MEKKTIYTIIGAIILIVLAVGAYYYKNPLTNNENGTTNNVLQGNDGQSGMPMSGDEGGTPPEGMPDGGTPPEGMPDGGSAPTGSPPSGSSGGGAPAGGN